MEVRAAREFECTLCHSVRRASHCPISVVSRTSLHAVSPNTNVYNTVYHQPDLVILVHINFQFQVAAERMAGARSPADDEPLSCRPVTDAAKSGQ